MNASIGPGDWVECVDVSAPSGQLHDGGFLVQGRIYQVERLVQVRSQDLGLTPGVNLVGQPALHGQSGRKGGYGLWRFRPIYRPKSDLIQQLQQPAPDTVRELVFDPP